MLADGPRGFWPLDETVTSVFHDISGHGFDTSGLLQGVAIGVTGLIPTSSDLAMSSASTPTNMFSNVNIPYTTNAFSVEAWVNTFATPAFGIIMGANNAGNNASILFYFYLATGVLHAFLIDNAFNQHDVSGAGSCSDGRTHYVVFTFDGSFMRLYKDGVANGAPTAAAVTMNQGTWATVLGRGQNGIVGNLLGGTLDEVALYDYALTPAQISAHYAKATTL